MENMYDIARIIIIFFNKNKTQTMNKLNNKYNICFHVIK